MSPSVGNFVHDLVEMAKAMEELPLVQQELTKASADRDAAFKSVADREESILRLKSEIESLNGRVREAEANRDDAELRFLELDEKAGKVLRAMASISDATATATELLSPPKVPEAAPMPEPVVPQPEPLQAQPDPSTEPMPNYQPGNFSNPLPGTVAPAPDPYVRNEIGQFASPGQSVADPTFREQASSVPSQDTGQQGQSEPLPTASPVSSPSSSIPTTVSSTDVGNQASAPADDVGYHNEPPKYSQDWYSWAAKMDARYGVSFWPDRPQAVG